MNLEVDVMGGDRFVAHEGRMGIYQIRGEKSRDLRFAKVDEWGSGAVYTHTLTMEDVEAYCKACKLKLKMVKPETQVETIKPPEWATTDGREVRFYITQHRANEATKEAHEHGANRVCVVRIDWGAK